MTTQHELSFASDFPPRDLSLKIRPVPHKRSFNITSFGPGADPAIQRTARSVSDVDLNIRPSIYSDDPEFDSQVFERERLHNRWIRDDEDWLGYKMRSDDNRKLLSCVEAHQNRTRGPLNEAPTDPTWGYYIFVTAYSDVSRQKLEPAMEALVRLTIRNLRSISSSPYGEEAAKRFKLDVVEDKEALEGASEDRVREEFCAQLRGLGMLEDDLMFRGIGSSRFTACILFDENTIEKLSNISFSIHLEKDELQIEDMSIRLIDPKWDYPAEPYPEAIEDGVPYRGADDCPVSGIAELYRRMQGDLMEEYPLLLTLA
ncbi:hypothetical protein FHETE_3487 [Fusarium heterosporum]|uniref:Uncharacterized protein n=1 Tax=Fusarium heterosporum TaxID=42747 RepID=A0A8H5TJ56_FUSHE|nr:hypothetical protein FHETE_3487 [Fusarium heterosporum]